MRFRQIWKRMRAPITSTRARAARVRPGVTNASPSYDGAVITAPEQQLQGAKPLEADQLVLVTGDDLRAALENARHQVGADAVVVGQAKDDRGVALVVTGDPPRGPAALAQLRARARRMLQGKRKESLHGVSGLGEVHARLERSGVSPDLTQRIEEGVARRIMSGDATHELAAPSNQGGQIVSATPIHPLDHAAREIGELFPVARAQREKEHGLILAFLGHAGVGKTSSICRLALRLSRTQGARRPSVLLGSLDTKPSPRIVQLAQRLGSQVLTGRDLAFAVARRDDYDALLIDARGDLARDVRDLSALDAVIRRVGSAARIDRYLVVPAPASRASLDAALGATCDLTLSGCIVTKLDEAGTPAPALEFAAENDLPIAFLSDGEADQRFWRARAERFADLCLSGRVLR